MGNAIPTTTDDDDGANLSESPEPSRRTVAVFESIRRKAAQLNAMSKIENIIERNIILADNIRTTVEKIALEKRWGNDEKDLLRLIHERIKPEQIKQFTTPELTDDQVDKIKKDMIEFAEDVAQARALDAELKAKAEARGKIAAELKAKAEARERAENITNGWTINPQNPDLLDSPRDWRGGSKKKRRTCKKLKAKQRTTTRALLKKWKKNEIKENNKKIRK